MKTVAIFALVALLAGCSASSNDTARIASLQQQVDALSAKVNKIESSKTALTDFDLQERCAAAAKHTYNDFSATFRAVKLSTVEIAHAYSKPSGQCFVVVDVIIGGGKQTMMELIEAPQGFVYGQYPGGSPLFTCFVTLHGKRVTQCPTKAQFYSYMAHAMGVPVGVFGASPKAAL